MSIATIVSGMMGIDFAGPPAKVETIKREPKPKNAAQRLLIRIGGTAALVAGENDMWWSDKQFSKKGRQRPHMPKKGTSGLALKSHFDSKNIQRPEKRRANHA